MSRYYCCSACDTKPTERKDFRRDHGGGPEEIPHKKSKGKSSPKKKGCPGNDNGKHIYVWIKVVSWYSWSQKWYTSYSKRCLGCDKHGDFNWNYVPSPDEIYETRRVPDWL